MGKARPGMARQGMPRRRQGTPRPRPRHALPRLPWPRQGQRQGNAAKARARQVGMPRPRTRQGCRGQGKAGPFYVLLGLENTIDEICNYGHPNPTEVTPMSCFESRYASRWNCATLSERMQGQFTGCSGSKVRLTRYAGTGIQIQLRRFQLVVSSPDTHVERNPQP